MPRCIIRLERYIYSLNRITDNSNATRNLSSVLCKLLHIMGRSLIQCQQDLPGFDQFVGFSE